MRDSFLFYRSFYEAIKDLEPEDRMKVYDAICEYALDGTEPELSGVASAMFKMAKPQVDANNKRYENGKKGGRPAKEETKTEASHNQNETKAKPRRNQDETKVKPNVNQGETKTEPNPNQNETKTKPNVNVNVNDNDNKKESSNEDKKKPTHKTKHGEYGKVLLTDEELQKLIDEYGQEKTQKAIKRLDEYIAETGKSYKSHYLTMKRWVFNAVEEDEQKTKKSQTVDMSQMPRAKPAAQNRFNNFDQRQYDFPNLEQTLLAAQRARDA